MGTLPSDRMSTQAVFNPYANGIEDLESDNEDPFSTTLSPEVSRKMASESYLLPASGEGNMTIATTLESDNENRGREWVDMKLATMGTATESDKEIDEDDDQVCYFNILTTYYGINQSGKLIDKLRGCS